MRLTHDSLNSPLEVIYREKGTDRTVIVSNPTDFPDTTDTASKVKQVQEPVVKASIIVPEGAELLRADGSSLVTEVTEYLGEMMDLCFVHRGEDLDYKYLDSSGSSPRIIMTCTIPLSEIVTDFFDKLKSRSSGFASFE
jgi:translation factor GUF1, mitochondrial